jgi:hypothetical protein
MFRKRKQLEIDYDKESGCFWVHDPNLTYWSSIPMGNVIIDIDKQGRLIGFEIFNANKLNIDMDEHENIVKFLNTGKVDKNERKKE